MSYRVTFVSIWLAMGIQFVSSAAWATKLENRRNEQAILNLVTVAETFFEEFLYPLDLYGNVEPMDQRLIFDGDLEMKSINTLDDLTYGYDCENADPLQKNYKYSFKSEFTCLACNIYFEARNQESYSAKRAIGEVTLNRVYSRSFPRIKSFSSTVCGVVWERTKYTAQFSWALDGKKDEVHEKEAWEEAKSIAWEIFRNITLASPSVVDATRCASHYHAIGVNPKWARNFKASTNPLESQPVRVGDHYFYYGASEGYVCPVLGPGHPMTKPDPEIMIVDAES